MKICFFNLAKAWGGGEKWHLDHAMALRDEGHDVIVLADKNGELLHRAKKNGLRTIPFSASNLSFLNPFKASFLFHLFKLEHFDVLVMNFSKDLKMAAPVAKLANITGIVYRRGSAIPIKNAVINRFLFGKCLTHVLANSETTKKTILENNPNLFPADKIKVIYNGISIKNQACHDSNNEIPVIGNIGRLVHQKGQDILIDVAEILKKRGVKCIIRIGGDGILMKKLQELVKEKDLSDYVEFTGFVDKPNLFLQNIDLFALSSRWEGFGYVLAEAMLAKKPLVAFDVSSNSELISNGKNGFLTPWGNKEAFADAIEQLILNPAESKKMGEAGYAMVCEKFNFDKNKMSVMDFLLETSLQQ
jgi:glycosyltransferase involved in cell wall biosynthesis